MHRRLLAPLLALALLVAGWAQLHHELDPHAHKPGEACEFCLFGAHLGHGIATTLVLPPPGPLGYIPTEEPVSRYAPKALIVYPARAPPLRSVTRT
jgi:hypothetical protein